MANISNNLTIFKKLKWLMLNSIQYLVTLT